MLSSIIVIASGLVSLAVGLFLSTNSSASPPAGPQSPLIARPTVRLLVSQRVEQLPQGPLCWVVNTNTGSVGGRNPATGYHAHGLNLNYLAQGDLQTEFDDGRVLNIGPGEGHFLEPQKPHFHVNTGGVPTLSYIFALTCGGPIAQPAGTRLDRTEPAPLPGIRGGAVPYLATLLEVAGSPGSQTPTQSTSGPLAVYVLEGSVAVGTADGVKHQGPNDLFVVPPDTPFQATILGDSPARALVALLIPAGELPQAVRTDVRLPSPGPLVAAAVPPAENRPLWPGPAAVLLGLFQVAIGAIAWRKRT